ncbi:MAG: ferrous iron transport protein B [Planctomycetes bacterium]|nr:ferrous iron transport protein B [Planctomycetota bacterium]
MAVPPRPGDAPLVALAGNPNTGKTSLFNRLTGSDQKVGNYPGITVERHEGRVSLPRGASARLVDVPGTYSLSARSAEEQIASMAIVGIPPHEEPALVVVVVDATQLLRNLYLALQVIETEVPVLVALNMVDMLAGRGLEIDVPLLERALGVPIVPVSGLSGSGIDALRAAIATELASPRPRSGELHWPTTAALEADMEALVPHLPRAWKAEGRARTRALALWSLLSIDEEDELEGIPHALRDAVTARRHAAAAEGREIEAEVIRARYEWIDRHAGPALREVAAPRSLTDRLDAALLHPVLGFALFLLTMGVVFQALFSWSDPAIGWIEEVFAGLSGLVEGALPAGVLRDFLTEGLIAGVGSVVVFLPQILLLFFFIGVMEDTGYMARVAFLMDRIMKALGLHGRAFVPMLSGFACAVPAILATRTMERRRDRMLTMMVVPLMSCSARLPVYALVIGALFPPSKVLGVLPVQGLLLVGMYVFSTLMALTAAWVLGRTLFRGPRIPLILELPPYRLPHWRSVLKMMTQRAGVFLREAGGVILVCTIGLWLLLAFPKHPALSTDYGAQRTSAEAQLTGEALDARLAELDASERGEVFRKSYGARLGRALEPAIEPLGFDWKIGVGLVGAFAAREVFVSTMGIVYNVGDEADEESVTLRQKIRAESYADGRPVYTPLVGLSLMVFFALACQCMSTLAAVKRETASWRWPLFLFAYMTALAWVASFVVYQGGKLLGFA